MKKLITIFLLLFCFFSVTAYSENVNITYGVIDGEVFIYDSYGVILKSFNVTNITDISNTTLKFDYNISNRTSDSDFYYDGGTIVVEGVTCPTFVCPVIPSCPASPSSPQCPSCPASPSCPACPVCPEQQACDNSGLLKCQEALDKKLNPPNEGFQLPEYWWVFVLIIGGLLLIYLKPEIFSGGAKKEEPKQEIVNYQPPPQQYRQIPVYQQQQRQPTRQIPPQNLQRVFNEQQDNVELMNDKVEDLKRMMTEQKMYDLPPQQKPKPKEDDIEKRLKEALGK